MNCLQVVIPVQFVLFTLSAITGSAILYGDFQKARFHEIVTFLYGCAATFAGVFIIAWTPKDSANAPAANGSADDAAVLSDSEPGSPEQPLGLGTLGRRNRATLIPAEKRDAKGLARAEAPAELSRDDGHLACSGNAISDHFFGCLRLTFITSRSSVYYLFTVRPVRRSPFPRGTGTKTPEVTLSRGGVGRLKSLVDEGR